MNSLNRGATVIAKAVDSIPGLPGIYKMVGPNEEILYIGKAKNLSKRVVSYTQVERLPYRLKLMVSQVWRVEIMTTSTEAEALLLEANLISGLKPKFNILLKDDKSFPYIAIELDHPFPRITKHRGKKQAKHIYFGPFASVASVNEAIEEIQKIFRIRPCSNPYFASRSRPCLQYQIKRCSAPCVRKINEQDYAKLVQATNDFLNGRNTVVQDVLKTKMAEASERMDFELAAEYRDRIILLSQVQAKNAISTGDLQDADFIGCYQDKDGNICMQILFIRNGRNYGNRQYFLLEAAEENIELIERLIVQVYHTIPAPPVVFIQPNLGAKLLEAAVSTGNNPVQFRTHLNETTRNIMEFVVSNARTALQIKLRDQMKHASMMQRVAELFSIPTPIRRIEVYDNSHMQGHNPVGCYIVAGPGGFIRNQYRIHKIRQEQDGDDYAMLREVLERRVARLNQENRPDLIIIDGGKGHLTIAQQVLAATGVPMVCIAKGVDRNAGREFFFTSDRPPFQLPIRDEVLVYLQGLRNEAHRFAITAHRKQRAQIITKSGLDSVPNVGTKRKKQLLTYFGSLEGVKAARIEDISRVPGISKKIAKIIYDYLHMP